MDRRTFLKVSALGSAAACMRIPPRKEAEAGTMTFRTSKRTGEKISLLGYGCMRWPYTKAADGTDVLDMEKAVEMVDYAMDHGVNYYDTAPMYRNGHSEDAVGAVMSRYRRDSYYLATKLSTFQRDLGDRQREASLQMYHDSFKYFRTDYIDYYLIHGAGIGGMDILHKNLLDIGILDFLLEEREKGNIRNLGFSFHGDVKVFDYLMSIHDQVDWDFVQIQMNYADWRHATGWNTNAEYLYGELAARGIQVVIMEPLLGGRLANLPEHIVRLLKERRPDDTAASWAFRFNGTFPQVLTVLSGMAQLDHIVENVKTFSPLEPCTDRELDLLENMAELFLKYPQVPCTACEYCMPCPWEIDIPGIFAHYNRCVNEGNIIENPGSSEYRKARRAFLVDYDRRVPSLHQADHCIGCGQCMRHCPQQIRIPDELHRIDRYAEQLKQNA